MPRSRPPYRPLGHKVIAHVCNNVGAWGAGFTRALDKRWPYHRVSGFSPRFMYEAASKIASLELSTVMFVPMINERITVANMICQEWDRHR